MNRSHAHRSIAGRLSSAGLLATVLIGGIAMATEQPEYEVIEAAGDYEIRRYSSLIVAETEVEGDMRRSGGSAFDILAGYIFGDNRRTGSDPGQAGSVKIAMTAPVLSKDASDEADASYTFSFVMPAEFTMATLPEPLDPRVSLREVPERVLAVRRFSGRASTEDFNENEARLRHALSRDGIEIEGETLFAQYNAPWVPGFMRRNEVMIGLDSDGR